VLAPGLEGTDFRGVRGWGRSPVPRNKRCLEDTVPGNPKKIARGSQGVAKLAQEMFHAWNIWKWREAGRALRLE
jgi:hypothetical protein